METSLHRTLKERYATGGTGQPEVVVKRFRVDAVDEIGRLVEVQSGALGPLRAQAQAVAAGPSHSDCQACRSQAPGRAEVSRWWTGRIGAVEPEARPAS